MCVCEYCLCSARGVGPSVSVFMWRVHIFVLLSNNILAECDREGIGDYYPPTLSCSPLLFQVSMQSFFIYFMKDFHFFFFFAIPEIPKASNLSLAHFLKCVLFLLCFVALKLEMIFIITKQRQINNKDTTSKRIWKDFCSIGF